MVAIPRAFVQARIHGLFCRVASLLTEGLDPMTGKRAIQRIFAFAGFVVLPLALPACTSSGYPFLTNRNPNTDYAEYVVARPTYGPDTGKPFFQLRDVFASEPFPARILDRYCEP